MGVEVGRSKAMRVGLRRRSSLSCFFDLQKWENRGTHRSLAKPFLGV